MRIVRYEDPIEGVAVDLHPRLSILSGLSDAARLRFITALEAIPAGSDPGAQGSIEVHGVFLDLTRESLELLELDEPLDVTVRASDLPNASERPEPPVPEAGAPGASVTADVVEPGAAAESEAARAAALGALEAAESERISIRVRLDELASRRREIAADVESARGALDNAAPSRLLRARGDLEALQRRSTAVALEEIALRRERLESQLEALIKEADEQRRELKRLASSGTEEVREALNAAAAACDPDLVPSAEAASIADRIEALDAILVELEATAATGRAQMHDLTTRRDAAYDAMIEAEAALRRPDLDAEVVEELEAIHDEIFELDGRVSKLSSSRLRRRMNELREREGELLTRLGFDTWSAYVMGMSNDGAEAERQQRYEVTKATYQFAEDELAKAAGEPLEVVGELADRQDERHQLLTRAWELLGSTLAEGEVVAALRNLQVPARPILVEREPALANLRAELAARGSADLPLDAAELMLAARRWLDEADDVATRRIREVEATRQHIESEINRIASDLESLPDPQAEVPALAADDPRLVAAEELVALEEGHVERHRSAQRLLDELRALDGVLRGDEDRAEAELVTADRAVRDAERVVADLEAARRPSAGSAPGASRRAEEADGRRRRSRSERRAVLDRLEWYLLARLAQQRAVSYVGSVPMVFDDAFVEWSAEELTEVLGRLVRMSEVIQLVILTDDVGLISWARALGREHAVVIDLQPVA